MLGMQGHAHEIAFDLVRARPTGDGSEVGGDFYDVFSNRINDWVVAVSDVCGEGIEAAVVTALARYTLPGRHRGARRVLDGARHA
jgi:serine phosphatase RsbU (regulator of sigma subunit)